MSAEISIEELQTILDRLPLTGSMPRMKVRMGERRCKKLVSSNWAHAHAAIGIRQRGLICFSNKGINRPRNEVLHTLAHEVTHMRLPARGHKSQKFIETTELIYQQILNSEKPTGDESVEGKKV